jgi:hypothetical protein
VLVESEAPFCAAAYELDRVFVEMGESELDRLIALHEACTRANHWPGYSEEIKDLAPPAWARKQYERENFNG